MDALEEKKKEEKEAKMDVDVTDIVAKLAASIPYSLPWASIHLGGHMDNLLEKEMLNFGASVAVGSAKGSAKISVELSNHPNNNYPKSTVEEASSQVPMLVDQNLGKGDDGGVDEEDQDIIDSLNECSDPQNIIPPRKGKQKKLAMSMKVMKKPQSRQSGLLAERNRVYSAAYHKAKTHTLKGGGSPAQAKQAAQKAGMAALRARFG